MTPIYSTAAAGITAKVYVAGSGHRLVVEDAAALAEGTANATYADFYFKGEDSLARAVTGANDAVKFA